MNAHAPAHAGIVVADIELARLADHPLNANVMPEARLRALQAHLRQDAPGGTYPALIVRERCDGARTHEILDGHHRAIALRRLGRTHARCEIWPGVSDDRARMLLLTLNRLRGEDDPHARGRLLALTLGERTMEELSRLLPDDRPRIERLVSLAGPPPVDAPPREAGELPAALTFFLTTAQREAALARLASLDRDRTRAFLRALGVAAESADAAAGDRAGAADAAVVLNKRKTPRHGGVLEVRG